MARKKSLFDFEDKSDIKSDNPEINKKYKNSKSEKAKRPTSDGTEGYPENTVTTVGEKIYIDDNDSSKLEVRNDPILEGMSTVWTEPSTSIDDKFIDIPKEEVLDLKPINGNLCVPNSEVVNFMDQFKPLQVSELPIHIVMNGKKYKIKDIEVDDWVKSIKDVITKYQKMNMLIIYLATSTYNSKLIDIEYYIKTNNLEDLLIEV